MKFYEISNRKDIDPAKKFEGLSFAFWAESRLCAEYVDKNTLDPEQKTDLGELHKISGLMKAANRDRKNVEHLKQFSIKSGYSFPVLSTILFLELNRITKAVYHIIGR